MKGLLALAGLALAAVSHALSFSDITNWTGAGSNEAALVIDWKDGGSHLWGYRWDGSATGEDMLRAVLASDSHLYMKVSTPTPYGVALFGLGYDENGGGLALSTGEPFVNRTIEVDGYDDADGAVAGDPADRYREGWYTGYWSYWVAEGSSPSWGYSGYGMSGRVLQNESWDGWSYDDFSGSGGPPSVTAVPEPASWAGLGFGMLALARRKRA